jgi:hypothetical protein
VVCKEEDYIARGARVRAQLQWIQEGDEGCKFFFDFLKKKVVADRVLGLCRDDGTLEENPTGIRGMFSGHFQNIFSSFHLFELDVRTRDACYRVVPCKASIGDRDRLEINFMKDGFFVSLS